MKFEEALERALGSSAELVVIGGEIALEPEALIGGERPLVVWDTRRAPLLEPELTIGVGAAARVSATGDERFLRVREACRAWFERVEVFGDAEARFFGGFAFEPGRAGPFASFGDASFVLPRLTASARGHGTTLELAVEPSELRAPERLLAEVRARLGARGSRTEPAPPARPIADGAESFSRTANRALDAIADGELEKVVVVRHAALAGSFALPRVLARLALEPETVRFGMADERVAFVGATPELLVATDGARVTSEAVAGTVARRGHEAEEIAALCESDKETREHAHVVRAVRSSLERAGAVLDTPAARGVRTLGRVHHLVTPVTAQALAVHVLDLVEALHPTPAVCGTPRAAARDWLRRHERVARGWFAAPFGFVDAAGTGAFVVALRSALLDVEGAHVYAGAGLVSGSRVELELAETELKFESVRAALDSSGGAA